MNLALQDRRVIEALVEGLVVHDATGAILDFNQRALEVLGLSEAQLRGPPETQPSWRMVRADLTALPPAEIPSVEARLTGRPVLRRRVGVLCEGAELRSLLVTAVPLVNGQGAVERVVALYSNVTEELARDHEPEEMRHFAHGEELSRSRQLLADAQEIAHLGTWEADGPRGTFTLSPRLRELLGLSGATEEPVPLEALVDCFTAEERPRVQQALERALTGEALSLQTRARGSDGDVRDLRLWTRARPAGSDARLFGVVQDISEQVRLNAQLQVTERMASIGTLAAGVAHEINNPLAYVLSNLTVALGELQTVRELPTSDGLADLIDALQEARDGAERVKQIVSDLRTFVRVDDHKRAPCDVQQVITAALNMARNETRHRAQVVTQFEATRPVLANRARLGQVFLNLIVNAAQAIPDGRADQNSITVTVREQGATIYVSVKDTGTGIAPEHLHRIFDPFFSTKAVGEGTGLGLFIAQNIVRDLGGELLVESAPGVGTTFELRLPAAQVSEPEPRPSPARVIRGARLLLVDDEPLLLKALGRLLGRSHAVTLAESGRAALELLGDGQRFDAVLCDMMMPDVSGLDVWEQLDPSQRRRFIFMTGGTFTERARRFVEDQRPLILEKPFSVAAFATVLAEVLTQSD